MGTLFIEPGSPWENGYVESFNGKLRDELLNGEIFYTLKGGKGFDREMEAAVQPHATAQLVGLPTTGPGGAVVEAGYAPLRRPQQPLVSTELLR